MKKEVHRKAIISKLLEYFHLNVLDRKIFIEKPLNVLELKNEIIERLDKNIFSQIVGITGIKMILIMMGMCLKKYQMIKFMSIFNIQEDT